eukprot:c17901_g1_i1 orf=129-338(-)
MGERYCSWFSSLVFLATVLFVGGKAMWLLSVAGTGYLSNRDSKQRTDVFEEHIHSGQEIEMVGDVQVES